jgi:hypothetical protein
MSATYIITPGISYAKKLEILIPELDFQILNSVPFLIYTATGVTTFVPIYAYITGVRGVESYTYNRLFFVDAAITSNSYGLLNIQAINGGLLDGASIWSFNMSVIPTSADGIRSVNNRDTYLKAGNADDLTGVGDMLLTIYYFEI